MIRTRQCRRCRAIKPVQDFGTRADGSRDAICRECRERAGAEAEYRAAEREAASIDERYWRRCPACGEVKPVTAFLPGFDHCRGCQRERRLRDGEE